MLSTAHLAFPSGHEYCMNGGLRCILGLDLFVILAFSPKPTTKYFHIVMVTVESIEKPKVRGEFYLTIREHLMILTTQLML
jgi:hypothetical protein